MEWRTRFSLSEWSGLEPLQPCRLELEQPGLLEQYEMLLSEVQLLQMSVDGMTVRVVENVCLVIAYK